MSRSNYKEIFKATSLFGGVQVITIITGLLRSKFVAIFLGPAGMGVLGLLVSTLNLIVTISSLGTNYSAVRNISLANESGDNRKLSFVLIVFRRWIWLSCFIGAAILICLSSAISKFTFGNEKYTTSFSLLSLMLIFTLLTNGNTALLEGTRQLRYTAKSTVIGALLGLLTSVPFYYFYGTGGLVPSLIIGATTTFLISHFFTRKIKLDLVEVSKKETIKFGSEMAQLGVALVLGQLLGSVVTYIINTYIRSKGGIGDVGLYQAGTMITNQSIMLVFTAMSVDYFPRLAAVSNDNKKVKDMVNQQAVITVLIACPLLIGLVVFAPIIINMLLTPNFYIIVGFVRWLAIGTLFTAPMVVIGYIALAKGDKKNYFLYGSFFNNILVLVLYLAGYRLNRLNGMAIGFFISQLLYFLFVYFKFQRLYNFSFNKTFIKIYTTLVILCLFTFFSTLVNNTVVRYLLGITFFSSAIFYSLFKLERLLGLITHLKVVINKSIN